MAWRRWLVVVSVCLVATFAANLAFGGLYSPAWAAINGVFIGTCVYVGARAAERRKHQGLYSGIGTSTAIQPDASARGTTDLDEDGQRR